MQPFLAMIMPVGGGPYPDNTLPGPQPPTGGPPGIWGPTDPRPTHPIAGVPPGGGGGQPPGIWGPTDPRPTPPIYIPPEGSPPPLGIWGPTDPRPGTGLPGPQPKPEHPIVLPPNLPPTTPEGGKIEWKTGWTAQTGWVVIGIPAEGTLVPTPSGQASGQGQATGQTQPKK
jgi:hypothetical protein